MNYTIHFLDGGELFVENVNDVCRNEDFTEFFNGNQIVASVNNKQIKYYVQAEEK
ncbi:hypothetical protein SFC08_01830 [Lysinibacillus halotolerans]